jgi:hypothetical protein
MDREHPAADAYTVERYLLGELEPAERDAFEAHYFACPECAKDLKVTAAFISAARLELRDGGSAKVAARPAREPWLARLWRPAFLSPVAALLLLTLAYQNLLVYPGMRDAVARLGRPEVLASISLIGSNSRGGALASGTLRDDDSLLLSFDVPATGGFSGYSAELLDPHGATMLKLPITAAQAKDTVSLRVPANHWQSGNYALVVRGIAAATGAGDVVARYAFTVQRPD